MLHSTLLLRLLVVCCQSSKPPQDLSSAYVCLGEIKRIQGAFGTTSMSSLYCNVGPSACSRMSQGASRVVFTTPFANTRSLVSAGAHTSQQHQCSLHLLLQVKTCSDRCKNERKRQQHLQNKQAKGAAAGGTCQVAAACSSSSPTGAPTAPEQGPQ